MRLLDNLNYVPRWVSHMGSLKSCIDYLGLDISEPWLYGGTGHAFILNISKISCPSGPTAWKSEMLFKLGRNLGYDIDGVFGLIAMDDFEDKQWKAWEHVKKSIDAGIPCYGWELEIAEYYTIHGYDEEGYYYKGPGCIEGKGPKSYNELSDTEIGILEIYSVSNGKPKTDKEIIKDSLSFALEHKDNPEKWIFPDYRAGLEGYDLWIEGVKGEVASESGLAYNAACWSECRGHAVGFLEEAKERITGVDEGFNEAIKHYKRVHQNLSKLTQLFPFDFPPNFEKTIEGDLRIPEAVEYLSKARKSESEGLNALANILSYL